MSKADGIPSKTPKRCEGCFYRSQSNGNGTSTCDYCYITGKKRGSSVEECTRYKKKEKKGKNETI